MQPVAIGGEFETRENGSNKPNPLPSLAASCAHNEMVRRGSIFWLCKERSSPANVGADSTQVDSNTLTSS